MNNTIESWFVNPEEKQLGILGQGYLASVLRGSFSRSVLILTQDRIYQRGRVLELTPTGRWIATKGHKVVEVRCVNGSAFKQISFPSILVLAIILLIMTLVSVYIGQSEEMFNIVALTLGFLALIFFVIYFGTRTRIFYIEYPGGRIGTQANWYSLDEISEFQKELSRAVDAKYFNPGSGRINLG